MEKSRDAPPSGATPPVGDDPASLPWFETAADPARELEHVVIVDAAGTVLAVGQDQAAWLPAGSGSCLGCSWYSYFPPDERAFWRQTVAEVLHTGTPRHCRIRFAPDRILDVRLLPLHGTGAAVTSLALCLRDVTREHRAQSQCHKLAAAIEQAAEAIIVTDERFRIEYVNQTFEAMTGVSQGQARGRSLKAFYKGRLQAQKFERGAAALERGDVWTGRFLLIDARGDTRMCDQTISPVRARHGVVTGYAFIWRDATEVSQLEKQLRHAQKLEVLGTLAGGIAHDFRNILGPIVLHAEMCLERVGVDNPLSDSLLEILDAVRRAKALGEQLLSLGRGVESDNPVRFRLSTLVKECIKFLRPGLAPGLAIRLQCTAGDDEMRADPAQIHQVIMNLYTNAVEAMREQDGGLLTIRIEEVFVPEGQAGDPSLTPGPYLRLSVSDTGHGMTSEIMKRIFEPFFSTKRVGQGTGLGLTVARHIVSRLRGTMAVESHPGLGTSFRVLLPKGPASRRTVVPPPAVVLPPRPPARLLFVDDDVIMTRCAAMALARLGYTVESGSSAEAALRLLAGNPERFDLALVGLSSPRHGGIELIRDLLGLRPDLPVILLSGHDETISNEMLAASGGKVFLAKPFCFDELDRVIREVLCAGT